MTKDNFEEELAKKRFLKLIDSTEVDNGCGYDLLITSCVKFARKAKHDLWLETYGHKREDYHDH